MILSLAFIISAFEWKTLDNSYLVPEKSIHDNETEIIPITHIPPPQPPKPKLILNVEALEPDEKEPELPDNFTFEMPEFIDDIEIKVDNPEPEKSPVVHLIVEKMPKPIGGYEEFYRQIAREMQYPSKARRMGIQGKVTLTFVISEKGEITEISPISKLGGGCEEEAIRVLGKMPAWSPGKQRGVPVKVRIALPIYFKLN